MLTVKKATRGRKGTGMYRPENIVNFSLNNVSKVDCQKVQLTSGLILSIRLAAGLPQARKQIPDDLYLVNAANAFSVNVSQPLFAWEEALWARTVRHVLSMRTPCSAQGVSSPFLGGTKSG